MVLIIITFATLFVAFTVLTPTDTEAAVPGLDGVISPGEYERSQELETDTFWVHWTIVDDNITLWIIRPSPDWSGSAVMGGHGPVAIERRPWLVL
jgi:hypothetical protein